MGVLRICKSRKDLEVIKGPKVHIYRRESWKLDHLVRARVMLTADPTLHVCLLLPKRGSFLPLLRTLTFPFVYRHPTSN